VVARGQLHVQDVEEKDIFQLLFAKLKLAVPVEDREKSDALTVVVQDRFLDNFTSINLSIFYIPQILQKLGMSPSFSS